MHFEDQAKWQQEMELYNSIIFEKACQIFDDPNSLRGHAVLSQDMFGHVPSDFTEYSFS